MWWDSQNYLAISEVSKYYLTPAVVLLILGAIMIVVGFLGCCGAVRESRCLLGLVKSKVAAVHSLALTHFPVL